MLARVSSFLRWTLTLSGSGKSWGLGWCQVSDVCGGFKLQIASLFTSFTLQRSKASIWINMWGRGRRTRNFHRACQQSNTQVSALLISRFACDSDHRSKPASGPNHRLNQIKGASKGQTDIVQYVTMFRSFSFLLHSYRNNFERTWTYRNVLQSVSVKKVVWWTDGGCLKIKVVSFYCCQSCDFSGFSEVQRPEKWKLPMWHKKWSL